MADRRTPILVAAGAALVLCSAGFARPGPYTEAGVNGYVNPIERFRRANPLTDPNAVLNPVFRGWATGVAGYEPAAGVDAEWSDSGKALGPATGDNFDIVSLGDLDGGAIGSGALPGRITLLFGDPCRPGDPNHIRDGAGYDFVVFENAFVSLYNRPTGSVAGQMLAELAYVEVSSNGRDFARFAGVSLTDGLVGPYGTIEISDVYNLAGKHPNANGVCTGTPFDLSELAGDPLVVGGAVDINEISYVRIVDIPGSGDFLDDAAGHIDPATRPEWDYYGQNHRVYDAWVTWGSGGFDLEAVGVLAEQEHPADIDLNGVVDMFDFALFGSAWGRHFGEQGWIGRCDLARHGDMVVDWRDLAAFAGQ
ncbi:MAG: hypothetical protein JSU94_06145, partial [Phycisphaerales bacterium]